MSYSRPSAIAPETWRRRKARIVHATPSPRPTRAYGTRRSRMCAVSTSSMNFLTITGWATCARRTPRETSAATTILVGKQGEVQQGGRTMTRTCRSCGQPLFAGANFCANCGAREEAGGGVVTQTGVTQPAAAEVTQPVAETPVAPPVQATAPIAPPGPSTPAVAAQGQGKWLAASAGSRDLGPTAVAPFLFSPAHASRA